MWMLLLALAHAQAPGDGATTTEALRVLSQQWTSVSAVRFDDESTPRVATDVTLDQGPATVEIESAWVVPLYIGYTDEEWAEWNDKERKRAEMEDDPLTAVTEPLDRRVGGLVFIGDASAELTIDDRRQRLWLGNRMVLVGEEPVDDWRPFVDGAPVSMGVDGGVLLGTRAAEIWAELANPDADADVVVRALSAEQGIKEAEKLFEDRQRAIGFYGMYAGQDAIRELLDTRAIGASALDLRTDRSWHRTGLKGTEDSYLTVISDPTGNNSMHYLHEVASVGTHPEYGPVGGVLGGVPFPPIDERPLAPTAPPVRVDPKYAHTEITARPGGTVIRVEVEQQLRLIPVGASTRLFQLVFPGREAKKDDWVLDKLTLDDGTPVRLPRFNEDENGINSFITIVLPEEVPEGEEIRLIARWHTTWPYKRGAGSFGNLGTSTGMTDYLPSVRPGLAGNPWRIHTRVRIPEDAPFTVALGGRTINEGVEDGFEIFETRHTSSTALWPEVAIGEWKTEKNPAAEDLPAVTTMLLEGEAREIGQFGPEVRRVISFYQRYLPEFPYPEVKIFQAPDGLMGFTWIAPHAMVNLQKARTFSFLGGGFDTPHLASGVLAHEIAHQYWGHVQRPTHTRDFWLAETFAETYACLYVGAAFGVDDFRVRMDQYRETWEAMEPGTSGSLVRAYANRRLQAAIVYRYGPYVFHAMLRPRIGDEAFFSALDVLLRDNYEQPISTEMLETYFEAAHGESLDEFFEYWVHSGYLPDLELRWSESGGQITGTITSSVPFGTVDVPVAVTSKSDEPEVVWVDVVDGEGSFTVSYKGSAKKLKVELDPDGRVLALSRKVRKE